MTAQASDATTLPRLSFTDLTYLGGFRLPRTGQGGHFEAGGSVIAYNPARNSLFVNSRAGKVAELALPTPVVSADPTQLPFASYLQSFYDPTEGHFHEIAADDAALAGLVVHGDRLYGTGSIYYDASNSQVLSHFSHSTDLAQPSFIGMSQVWDTGKAGFVAGYLATIPSEWQTLLGGAALTGQCCIPIVTRTSFGPAAFAWNPTSIGRQTAVPATPLLYYTQSHATLGPWDGANPMYGGTALMGGAAVIAGTRTALFIGRNGLGEFCYGHGTGIQSLHGTRATDGEKYCYDPTSDDKGQHAYPYQYQIWAYDLADFAAVKAGSKAPWDVVPYAVWPFNLPTPEASVRIGGVAYDAERQLLYFAQMYADRDGYAYRPVVHALKINATASITPAAGSTADPRTPTGGTELIPLPATPAPAAPSTSVSSVTLASSAPAPQPVAANITWVATPSGGDGTLVYKWFLSADGGGSWTATGPWASSNRFEWTPAAANPNYKVAVWVKRAASEANEAAAEAAFPITDSAPVSSVSIAANVASPQPVSSSIVWSATSVGGTGTLVYKWFVSSDGGGSWSATGPWASSPQFAWTPTAAGANYRVTAWVKRASNTSESPEASAEKAFAISERPVASVALNSNLASPQPLSTTIQWTATQAGGTGAIDYKWFISNDGGGSWTAAGPWGPSNQLTWTPAAIGANYRVTVWARRASNAAESAEAAAETAFAIVDRPVSTVTLTSSLVSPQPLKSTIVWTATQSGATGAVAYKWFVSNDGGASWTASGPWSASNQLEWTPADVNASYRVAVWARRASSAAESAEAAAEAPFAITEPPTGPVTSVTLSANLAAPQPVSTTIVWTATPVGGDSNLVYKWYVSNDGGASWTATGPWASPNRLTWTPGAVNANYRVVVWVKRASNASDSPEAAAERAYAINAQ